MRGDTGCLGEINKLSNYPIEILIYLPIRRYCTCYKSSFYNNNLNIKTKVTSDAILYVCVCVRTCMCVCNSWMVVYIIQSIVWIHIIFAGGQNEYGYHTVGPVECWGWWFFTVYCFSAKIVFIPCADIFFWTWELVTINRCLNWYNNLNIYYRPYQYSGPSIY